MKRGRKEHLAVVLSLVVVMCQLLRREHCVEAFRGSEQSIPDSGIVERDAMPKMNHIERDGIEELEE